jgi:serine/threonine-protein kinase
LSIIETELVLYRKADGKERMQQEIWFQKYKILGLLGRGGTARVYLAEHILLKSYRAIKCISKNHPQYELQRNEAFILKNLKHSCIPIIYDIEEDDKGSYIVEEYIEGITLTDYVLANGALREDIIIQAGIQLCDLIQYLHSAKSPVFYLDLKPDNILISGSVL